MAKHNPKLNFIAQTQVNSHSVNSTMPERLYNDSFLNSGPSGSTYSFAIPSMSAASGLQGFSVQFVNDLSSVKYYFDTRLASTESVSILDPSPTGTGEWVSLTVPKWDLNTVC